MRSDAYNQYLVLAERLRELVQAGKEDSKEAEQLRDLMDPLWWKLTATERAKLASRILVHSKEASRERF